MCTWCILSRARHAHGMHGRYELMLRAVLADGVVHPLEKSMLRDYAAKNEVSELKARGSSA